MNIPKSILSKSKEHYQQELDAIDNNSNQYPLNSVDVSNRKIKVYQQWTEDLSQATTKLNVLIARSKKKLQEIGDVLRQLRNDFEQLREELDNDDSGIGEMLTADIDFERRSAALSETIDNSMRELDQWSVQMTEFEEASTDINSQFAELQEKFGQFAAETQQEIDN